MAYQLRYSPQAVNALKQLRPFDRAAVLDALEKVLAVNPTLESKARVKRHRQPAPTQYRLRVGGIRICYDVAGQSVIVVRILSKEEAITYLGEE